MVSNISVAYYEQKQPVADGSLQLSCGGFAAGWLSPLYWSGPAYQVREQLLLGCPGSRLRVKIHHNRPGQGKFGVYSCKGIHPTLNAILIWKNLELQEDFTHMQYSYPSTLVPLEKKNTW